MTINPTDINQASEIHFLASYECLRYYYKPPSVEAILVMCLHFILQFGIGRYFQNQGFMRYTLYARQWSVYNRTM